MSLTSVLEKIKKLEVHAKESVDEGPLSTMSARRGRKNQAIAEIGYLREEYVKELHRNAIFIITVGSARDEFASIAKSEFFSFSTDPTAPYKELADKIPEIHYKDKTSSAMLFDVLGRHIEDMANRINLAQYNYVIFKQEYDMVLRTKEDLSGLIKRAVNEQMGSELVGIYAVRSILEEALSKSHESKYTAIVLPTDDEELAKDLKSNLQRLTHRVYYVVAGKASKAAKLTDSAYFVKEVTKESVEKTLDEILKNK